MNVQRIGTCRQAAMLALALLVAPASGIAFTDPLDCAAQTSPQASRNLLLSVARAGDRLVAVGQRGHVVYSDDQGASWKQAVVPVCSDLTAVWFVNAGKGWAVGHDGVVLYSANGGVSWIKQLDGRSANALLVADLERKLAAGQDSKRVSTLLAEARRYLEAGPDKPFLDVWFSDDKHGYVVGAYNLIFRTVDGGTHWEPWFDRTDNPNFSHLNAIRGVGDHVYVAGERGLFLQLDVPAGRFVGRATPYAGSWFALAATPGNVTAFGMRGNAYRTSDEGLTWKKIETGVQSGLSGASVLDDGRIVAVSQAGQVLASKDNGATFAVVKGIQPMVFSGVSGAGSNRIAVTGTQGVRVEPLP